MRKQILSSALAITAAFAGTAPAFANPVNSTPEDSNIATALTEALVRPVQTTFQLATAQYEINPAHFTAGHSFVLTVPAKNLTAYSTGGLPINLVGAVTSKPGWMTITPIQFVTSLGYNEVGYVKFSVIVNTPPQDSSPETIELKVTGNKTPLANGTDATMGSF